MTQGAAFSESEAGRNGSCIHSMRLLEGERRPVSRYKKGFFMRLISLIALFLALPLSAYAEGKRTDFREISSPVNSSVFQKLETLFNVGTVPVFSPTELVGLSGRCFDRAHEYAVKGAAYLTEGGIRILSIWSDDLTAYDLTCASDIVRAGVSWSPACVEDGSLVALIDETTGSFLRASGKDYIEKVANHRGTGASHYCYYARAMAP